MVGLYLDVTSIAASAFVDAVTGAIPVVLAVRFKATAIYFMATRLRLLCVVVD